MQANQKCVQQTETLFKDTHISINKTQNMLKNNTDSQVIDNY